MEKEKIVIFKSSNNIFMTPLDNYNDKCINARQKVRIIGATNFESAIKIIGNCKDSKNYEFINKLED